METAGPPAFLRETTFEDQISVRKRFRDAARSAFRNTAETLGLEVHESELFNLQNPPETVDMVDSLRRKLLGGGRRGPRGRSQEGASLYEPKKASGTDRTQVAMLTVKLPRGPEQLDQFLKENRRNSIISSRSSFLQKNVGVFLSQADLSLVTPPPGSEATERKETSSSERTPGDRPDE